MTGTEYGSGAERAEERPPARAAGQELAGLAERIARCRRCPRLVEWREQVARERRAAFREQKYWGRPVPGFGDPAARVLLLGLAPAAHGANRTGRMFTGDRSGDFLFAALWRSGFASQPTSVSREDGLSLRDAFITAAVRCAPPANRPTPQERDRCLPWSLEELALLAEVRVVVCLGAFAWDAALRLRASAVCKPPGAGGERSPGRRAGAGATKPRFAHGAELAREPAPPGTSGGAAAPRRAPALIGCFHPSQQNTFTGRLTEPMIDQVLSRARTLAGLEGAGRPEAARR